jgi:hypothetical protein
MTTIDYRRFGMTQLGHLLEQSKRLEQDFQDRFEARLQLGSADDANRASTPDPVARRLGFLLAKARNRRRAVVRELAMRVPGNSDPCGDGEPDR